MKQLKNEKDFYFLWILQNLKELLTKTKITIEQFDDMFTSYFGVWGNFGENKTPEIIDELSPNVPRTEQEQRNAKQSLLFSIIGMIMKENPFDETKEYPRPDKIESKMISLNDIREILKNNYIKRHDLHIQKN